MLKTRYLNLLHRSVEDFFQNHPVKAFIFGSSVNEEVFRDVDIGLVGDIGSCDTEGLKEYIHETHLPYLVDVVNFDNADEKFKNYVLKNKIVWIKK